LLLAKKLHHQCRPAVEGPAAAARLFRDVVSLYPRHAGQRLDRIPVSGINRRMIRSFGDRPTEALFQDERVRQFAGIARRAKRKLEAVNAANRLDDLAIPPSNRLEKLKGDRKEFYSIRINDQRRVIFKWIDGEPHEVRIVDYH
jgi:toxin HigB-1